MKNDPLCLTFQNTNEKKHGNKNLIVQLFILKTTLYSKEVKYMYRWRARFEIINSLHEPQCVNGYEFKRDKENRKIYIDVFYDTSKKEEDSEVIHNKNDSIEMVKVHEYQSKIENLLFQRMIYLEAVEPIEVNFRGIEGYDRTPRITFGITNKNNVQTKEDSLKDSNDFWEAGFRFSTDEQTRKELEKEVYQIAKWFSLAEKQNDNISFILAWVAFNGLYSLFSRHFSPPNNSTKDRVKWKHTLDKLLREEEAKFIVENYAKRFDTLQSHKIKCTEPKSNNIELNCNDELKKLRNLPEPNYKKIIKCAMNCIYSVRNDVFHEASLTETVDDRCGICKNLLIVIAIRCLRNFVLY